MCGSSLPSIVAERPLPCRNFPKSKRSAAASSRRWSAPASSRWTSGGRTFASRFPTASPNASPAAASKGSDGAPNISSPRSTTPMCSSCISACRDRFASTRRRSAAFIMRAARMRRTTTSSFAFRTARRSPTTTRGASVSCSSCRPPNSAVIRCLPTSGSSRSATSSAASFWRGSSPAKSVSLKAALLDQSLIAGLGNIYVCEALHRAGLSPRRAAATLARRDGTATERAHLLAASIRQVLEEALAAGGSSLRDHQRTDGTLGLFPALFPRLRPRGRAVCDARAAAVSCGASCSPGGRRFFAADASARDSSAWALFSTS